MVERRVWEVETPGKEADDNMWEAHKTQAT